MRGNLISILNFYLGSIFEREATRGRVNPKKGIFYLNKGAQAARAMPIRGKDRYLGEKVLRNNMVRHLN